MKITYIITRADEIGGAQVHVRDLACALHDGAHTITVLAGNEGALSAQLRAHGVPFLQVPSLVRPIAPLDDLRAVRDLRRTLRTLAPDLVTTHSSKAGWLGRLAARSLGIPVVFTAHGFAFTEGVDEITRRMYAFAERLAAPFADHIVAVSDYDRDLALRFKVVAPARITRIHNGAHDLIKGPPPPPPPPGAPTRIIMTARFAAPKDHAFLLQALAGLADRAFVVDFVGTGPTQPASEALARELGLADRVHFLGQREDVPSLLRAADVYALISRWEGLPYGILEAMSAGLPQVVSNVGGVPEAVVGDETGLLVERGDCRGLTDAFRRLLDDPDLRRRLGAAARRRYKRAFRFELMRDHTLALYQRVAAGRLRR